MRFPRPTPARLATLAASALVLAACSASDPSSPTIEAQQLALAGDLEVTATLDVPDGRGPGDTLRVRVTVRNRTREARQVSVGSSTCIVSVRLLAAAPGAGASATFYDDFLRPCTRDLKYVQLAAGGSQTFVHAVPADRIPASAPEEMQAHVGMQLDAERVLLNTGPFRIPRTP
jgi:hypothetical protein